MRSNRKPGRFTSQTATMPRGMPEIFNKPTLHELPAPATDPTEDQVRDRAYALWEARGCVHGDALADWYQAVRELREERAGYAFNGFAVDAAIQPPASTIPS